jgi:hypothetical protein
MSETRPQPYVGISGVARHEQQLVLQNVAERERIDFLNRFLMIGVQATGKTQVLEVENKRGQMWHPVGDTITDAAFPDYSGLTQPYVHCFFEGEEELRIGIDSVMRRTLHYSKGVQLNGLPWMTTDYRPFMYDFLARYPLQSSIILQANRNILDNFSPAEVAAELETMPVDYILLDPSAGFGIGLDPDQIQPFVDEIYQRQLPVRVVVAGGLEAQNIDLVFGPLVEYYPGLSCDAEGRLRKGSEGRTVLDLDAAEAFLVAWKGCLLTKRRF